MVILLWSQPALDRERIERQKGGQWGGGRAVAAAVVCLSITGPIRLVVVKLEFLGRLAVAGPGWRAI
jgi:hypothetical protein